MASEKALLIDSIQKNLGKSNWKAAIGDMEKLFDLDPDPIIRVRIGDAYQKLGQVPNAVKEYLHAADIYATKGVIVKALAQYKLVLRLDPNNTAVQGRMSALHSNKAMMEKKPGIGGESAQKAARSVIPLFAGLQLDEFEDFVKMMTVHTLQPGHVIVAQGDTGKSVYVIASGSVKVHTMLPNGERLDLAVLDANDFFGEMSFLTGKPRTATVETAEDSVVLEVTEDQLRELVGRRPRVLQVLQQYSAEREKGTSKIVQSTQQPEPAPAPQEKKPVLDKPAIPAEPEPSRVNQLLKTVPEVNPADKPKLIDAIQKYVSKANWKAAIPEMEKLFAIDRDPIIRVRIGDAYQKLNQKPNAVREYVTAADLYAEKGAVVKALAQYKLALRIEPGNKLAQERIQALHSNRTVKEQKTSPVEKEVSKPASSVLPLFAGFSQEEFNDFTTVMNAHPLPGGMPIVEQNDTGKSVYLIASGAVKVYTTLLSGERIDLAVLRSGDFFGEMSFLTGKPRTATVETLEDSVLLEVTEDKLREITSQRPRILEVLQKFSAMRSKGTTEKIQESNQ